MTDKKFINIAIDGPSGAGKSTIARILSDELGYIYIDTGALYRAVGYHTISEGVDVFDVDKVASLLAGIKVTFRHVNGEQRVFVNDTDVSDNIRSSEVSTAASAVSAIPAVREFLLDLQRDVAKNNNIVMDGRDIGTVILPKAQIKIFLTATAEDRSLRRYDQMETLGILAPEDSYENILKAVNERDYNDSNRRDAPLKRADDAILVDTTGNELEKSIEVLKGIVKSALEQI